MPRRLQFRHLAVFALAVVGGMAASPPLQTALQAPQITPIGRVCSVKDFGSGTPTGLVDPIWFNWTGAMVSRDGFIYTTSPAGGRNGVGAVIRLSPAGDLKVMYDFTRLNREDGSGPQSGLIDGNDGYFWGTTYGGGHIGSGTIFRIPYAGTKAEILHHFRNGSVLGLLPDCPDHRCPFTGRQRADAAPSYPTAPPVMGPGGVLYGVTSYSNNQGFGALYRFAPPYDSTGFQTLCIFDQRMLADPVMKQFVCESKGTFPGALVISPDRLTLYGTTLGGNGSVYKSTLAGETSTLHEFKLTDGAKPYNLLLASNGKLYGTTSNGGATGGGVMYRLETSGDGVLGGGFTVISNFRVNSWLQGLNPIGALVETRAAGSLEPLLFGTTRYGGKGGRGILFRMPLSGDSMALRVLHDFDLWTTGRSPMTPMVVGPTGLLYGLTYQGGKYDKGAMYSLDPRVLDDVRTSDAYMTGGVRALDDNKALISDPIVEIWTGAAASQTGVDPATGKTTTIQMTDGIVVRGRCPNPHIVQFIYRERLSSQGVAIPGVNTVASGSYNLTTSLNDIQWHTDALAPVAPLRNAYLDQNAGPAHTSAPSMVAIFDRPSFGVFDDPRKSSPNYDPAKQNADLTKSETWRATVRDFLICNCQVTKEIWWSREVRGGKGYFAHIRVMTPAADALQWINKRLAADGYASIP